MDVQRAKLIPPIQPKSLWLVASIAAFAILPVFLVQLPSMNDYPGHLARMYLLSSIGTPNQNPYYYFYLPFIYPNLAMDIVVPTVAQFIDVESATKTFLVLSQILVVSGAVALEIAVKRRHEFAGFVGAAVLYCLPFAWGFLNFEFGVGLALWGIASWFAFENKEPFTRLAVHMLLCASLFICHLVAFGLYAVTLVFYEFWRALQPQALWKRSAQTLSIMAAPAAIVFGYFVLCMYIMAKETPKIARSANDWDPFAKFISILHGMNGYSAYLSIAIILALVVTTYFMFREQCFSITPLGKWMAIGFLVLILVLPYRLFGGDLPSLRIATGALLILPAFLTFQPAKPMLGFVPAIVLSLIALLNAGQIANLGLSYRTEYATLLASFKLIQRESIVLVGYDDFENKVFDKAQTPTMTATALTAHYANAYVSTLVAIPGQQPLQVCPALSRLALVSTGDYWPVPFSLLAAVANNNSTPDVPAHVRDWTHDYDYLYLVGAEGPNLLPSRLKRLAAGKSFVLYQIIRAADEENVLRNGLKRQRADFGEEGPCQQRSPTRSTAGDRRPRQENEVAVTVSAD